VKLLRNSGLFDRRFKRGSLPDPSDRTYSREESVCSRAFGWSSVRRGNVAVGSVATEPLGPRAEQCPLLLQYQPSMLRRRERRDVPKAIIFSRICPSKPGECFLVVGEVEILLRRRRSSALELGAQLKRVLDAFHINGAVTIKPIPDAVIGQCRYVLRQLEPLN